MPRHHLFLFALALIYPALSLAAGNELVLGYPERDKDPLIAEAPDYRGVYYDLFSKAAKKAGLTLKIVRYPKKRVFTEMQAGNIDIYPGSFANDRIPVMNWVDSGLKTRYLCLTLANAAPITDLHKAGNLRIILEVGDSKLRISDAYPNLIATPLGTKIDLDQAISLLKAKRGDLFIIERDAFLYFMKQHQLSNEASIGLRAHWHCHNELHPILLGISRQSAYYKEIPNPGYNPNAATSASNLPTLIDPASRIGKMAQALRQMRDSGEAQKLLEHYTGKQAPL